MSRLIIRRLVELLPLLIGITLLSFFVMHLAPGDPTALFIDPHVKPEELARLKANWGLDRPVIVQYFYWLKNVLVGDFGRSYLTGRPVIQEIMERIPATLLLMGSSLFLSLAIAIPVGVYSAVKKNSRFDRIFSFISFLGISIPSFWLALMLILLFSLTLGWFPSFGMTNPLLKDAPWWIRLLDLQWHLALPVFALTFLSIAGLTRYQRAAVLEVLREDYIRTARAKGLPERIVFFKHALRNALLPLITLLGLSLPDLFSGAFIIETVFGWPGLGRLGVTSVFQRNYPLIMGIVVFSSILIILGNMLADMGYALADPRIRYDKRRS